MVACGDHNEVVQMWDPGFTFLPWTHGRNCLDVGTLWNAAHNATAMRVVGHKTKITLMNCSLDTRLGQGAVEQTAMQNVPLHVFRTFGKGDDGKYWQSYIRPEMVVPLSPGDDLYDCNNNWTVYQPYTRTEGSLKRCQFNLGSEILASMKNEHVVNKKHLFTEFDGYFDCETLAVGGTTTSQHFYENEGFKPWLLGLIKVRTLLLHSETWFLTKYRHTVETCNLIGLQVVHL